MGSDFVHNLNVAERLASAIGITQEEPDRCIVAEVDESDIRIDVSGRGTVRLEVRTDAETAEAMLAALKKVADSRDWTMLMKARTDAETAEAMLVALKQVADSRNWTMLMKPSQEEDINDELVPIEHEGVPD